VADDTEGRERGTDELFEDLDKFFAPIHDVDWPEQGEEAAGAGARSDRPAGQDPRGTSRQPPPSEEPGGDEVSEAGADEIADAEVSEVGADDLDTGVEPPRSERGVDQATQELSSDEWEDLRARFGRGEPIEEERAQAGEALPPGDDDPYSFMRQFLPTEGEEAPEGADAAGEPSSGGQDALELGPPSSDDLDEEAQEEPSGLTVDDLRKAPQAYRDLPAPPAEDEEAVDAGLIAPQEGEDDLAAAMWGDEGPADEAAEPSGALEPEGPTVSVEAEGDLADDADAFEPLEGEPAEDDLGVSVVAAEEEPPPGGVEAAAEHFAEAIRQSGELPVISADASDSVDLLEPGPDPVGDDLEAGFEQEPPAPRTIKVGASEFGPSWQESTSVEVATAAEQEPAAPGRNVPLAFLVGAGLAIIGLGSLAISKAAFTVVAGIVVILAQSEMYAAVRRRNYQPAVPVGLVFGALTIAAAYLKGEQAMLAMVALSVPFTVLWFMAMPPQRRRGAVVNIAMTIFPLVYVPFLAGFVMLTLAASTTLMISVLGLAVGYDIAAFAIGSWFGERPLAPTISPSKTWEGLVGATLVILLVSIVFLASVDPISTLMRAAGLAVVISVFAPLGDLAESMMKRDLGLKDMGSILPGHGGVLDRIDSLLFAAPAAWYFFRIFF
jgi:phosphatidate cytidylyltransferase